MAIRGPLAAALLLGLTSAGLTAEKVLHHDTGRMGGKQSSAGSGHVISFEAPKGSPSRICSRSPGASLAAQPAAAAYSVRRMRSASLMVTSPRW